MRYSNLNIGFILSGDEQYGVRRLITSILSSMAEAGQACFAISLTDGEIVKTLQKAGVDVVCLNLPKAPNFGSEGGGKLRSIPKVFRYSMHASKSLRAELLSRKADTKIALIVRMPNLVPLVGLVARRLGISSAWLMPNLISDNYPFQLNRKLYDAFFYLSHMKVIANSAFTRTTLGRTKKSAFVMHLGVRGDEFLPSLTKIAARDQLNLPSDRIVITVLSRLLEEKGHQQIISGLSYFEKKVRDNIHLLIVGGPLRGEYFDRLQYLVAQSGLSDNVTFSGAQSDLLQYYCASDITINWRLDPEPFGLSVVESLFMERPVLAHSAGGPGETVIDGVTGWLSNNNSSQDFKQTLARALSVQADWECMGKTARRDALTRFDTKVVAAKLYEIMNLIDSNDIPVNTHEKVAQR